MHLAGMSTCTMEGFEVPQKILRMAALSEGLVHERITVCKAMGGLGVGRYAWVVSDLA